MWNEEIGERIAALLKLMAQRPNKRSDPQRPGIELFDGGERRVMTGLVSYSFSNGSRALWGTGPDVELTINLATGEQVHIAVTT